jgi:hypothetical protein
MKNELEKFIQANRDAFDDEEPSGKVWQHIEKQVDTGKGRTIAITRSLPTRVLSVAAVLLAVTAGAWLLFKNNAGSGTGDNVVAARQKQDTTLQTATATPTVKQPAEDTALAMQTTKDNSTAAEDNTAYNEELYYYAKLTELKFKQLKSIEKEEPVLYHNFYGEIKKLDSTYHNLQTLLASNADKEAVLSAMLTNLKIQSEVLSKQLTIIKTIKQSKKKQYEKDYKNA